MYLMLVDVKNWIKKDLLWFDRQTMVCLCSRMVRVLAWTVEAPGFGICLWGTGVSGLTRGLATLPQGGSRSLRWSDIRMEDPQEDPLAMHCFCVCSGSVLLGDLLGVSRSRECDLLSVLFIYPRFFLYVQYVSSHSLSLFYSAVIWCMFVALVELSILAPPFRFTASVLWCWSWEKEGRAVEVVPGI